MIARCLSSSAVSIGIAPADTLGGLAQSTGGRLAIAILLGLAIAAMGRLTAAVVHAGERPARRD